MHSAGRTVSVDLDSQTDSAADGSMDDSETSRIDLAGFAGKDSLDSGLSTGSAGFRTDFGLQKASSDLETDSFGVDSFDSETGLFCLELEIDFDVDFETDSADSGVVDSVGSVIDSSEAVDSLADFGTDFADSGMDFFGFETDSAVSDFEIDSVELDFETGLIGSVDSASVGFEIDLVDS